MITIMGRAIAWSCAGLIITTMSIPPSFAQTTTAALRGIVTDVTGAVLPGAAVEVSGPTGRRATESEDVGFYRALCLRKVLPLEQPDVHLVALQPREEIINGNGLPYGGGSSLDGGLPGGRLPRHDPGTAGVS